MSGFAAAIALSLGDITNVYINSEHEDYPFSWDNLQLQASYTIVSMITTIIISIICGGITGWIMVLLPFPKYEFKDSDNFYVFFNSIFLYDYHGKDSFRDTIRGPYFGKIYQLFDGGGSNDNINKSRIQDQDTLRQQDYHWNDGNNIFEVDNHAGIQVVDSMINGMAIDSTDWRQFINNDLMPDIKSISYAKILRDYYFDENEDELKDEDTKSNPDEDEMFYPSYHGAKIKKQTFDKDKDVDGNEDKKDDEEYEYYITAKLKSNVNASNFKRKNLNLVIVLDIEGAICSDFEYELNDNQLEKEIVKQGNENEELSKIILLMINKNLTNSDRIGVVGNNKIIQSLDFKNKIDLENIKKEIIFLDKKKK